MHCYRLLVIFTFLHGAMCFAENLNSKTGLRQQRNTQQRQQQQSVRIPNKSLPEMKSESREDQTASGQTGAKFHPPTKLNATNPVQNMTLTQETKKIRDPGSETTRNTPINEEKETSDESMNNPRSSQELGRSQTGKILTAEGMTMKTVVPTSSTTRTRPTPKAIMKPTTNIETTRGLVEETTTTNSSPEVSTQENGQPQVQISSNNEVKPKLIEEPNPKPLTVHDLMKHIFGNGSRTKFQNHDNDFPPNFLRNFFNTNSSTMTDADIEYKKSSSSKDTEESRPNLRITTHEENSSETLTGYFQFGRQFLRTRSRDAVWAMISMVLIVGGSIICILWTRMWKNRHFDWINVQEPLPPVKVSMREVVLTRAKYLPKQRSKWHRGKKYISFRNESDTDRSESEGEFVVIDVGKDIID